jgi:hypothetical protein
MRDAFVREAEGPGFQLHEAVGKLTLILTISRIAQTIPL